MRTIIAGGRNINNPIALLDAIELIDWMPSIVLCGGAKGVDTLGELWAREYRVPVEYYLADWNRYGRGAGFIRNAEMVLYADALIALWDGHSKGTANMITVARKHNLKTFVYLV